MASNREVEVVENLIRILNECLVISIANKRKEESKRILIDIDICKKELKKLLASREAAKKEPAKDAALQ